jgi:hypothetical protein
MTLNRHQREDFAAVHSDLIVQPEMSGICAISAAISTKFAQVLVAFGVSEDLASGPRCKKSPPLSFCALRLRFRLWKLV